MNPNTAKHTAHNTNRKQVTTAVVSLAEQKKRYTQEAVFLENGTQSTHARPLFTKTVHNVHTVHNPAR
jgi:hypothetical protein